MSDAEVINDEVDNLDLEVEVIEPHEPEDKAPSSPKFISRDDWIASGKDADEWRSPREFKERGEFIERLKNLERKNDNDIKNLNTLHEIRLKNEREDLLKRRDDAIDVADRAEVKRLDAQIAENKEQADIVKVAPAPQGPSREVEEFMEEYPWAQDPNDDRTKYAQSIINHAMDVEGKTTAYALRLAAREVEKKFTTQQKRTTPLVEGSRTSGAATKSGGALSWGQLTAEEAKCFVPGMWESEAQFLKSVANLRKGAK